MTDAENGTNRTSLQDHRDRRGSVSINVHELLDNGEENELVLKTYFQEVVLPLAAAAGHSEVEGGSDVPRDEGLVNIMTRERRR